MKRNYQEREIQTGKEWHDYVTDIDYKGHKVNLAEHGESREQKHRRILESMKETPLRKHREEIVKKILIRLI